MNELKTPEIEKEIKPLSKKSKKTNKTNQTTEKGYRLAIEVSDGTITDISRRLKRTTGTVTLYFDKHPEIKAVFEKRRLTNIDRAESVLFSQLDFKDNKNKSAGERIRQKSAQYITERLGRDNGWGQKQELELSGNITSLTKEEREAEIKRLLK